MALPDSFKTIISLSEFKLKEKGSQFITYSNPISSEEEALTYLEELRKKFYNATHHCYSYKLMDGSFKYSDDGEPNGTAGIRIYNAQNHFELTNLITVVIRYFGGTKLGVGPLGKAYYRSAFESLQNASIVSLIKHQTFNLQFEHSFTKTIHHLINKYNAKINSNSYDIFPTLTIQIRDTDTDSFITEINQATFGKCKIINIHRNEYLPLKPKC